MIKVVTIGFHYKMKSVNSHFLNAVIEANESNLSD